MMISSTYTNRIVIPSTSANPSSPKTSSVGELTLNKAPGFGTKSKTQASYAFLVAQKNRTKKKLKFLTPSNESSSNRKVANLLEEDLQEIPDKWKNAHVGFLIGTSLKFFAITFSLTKAWKLCLIPF